jgi:hypothetical protein
MRQLPALLSCAGFLFAQDAITAELKPHTLKAFEDYIRGREARMRTERLNGGRFLWTDDSPERARRVRAGEAVIEPGAGKSLIEINDGLIHDWVGAAFVPGAMLGQVLDLVQNYDNHKNIYPPEVIESRLRSRNGNDFKVHLRLLKKKVVTVVLNTEHDVRYFPIDEARAHSRSYSTRIAEVVDPGEPGEHERPPGHDHGFLWRLYSYWRFQEKDGGVYVECEAISLTRGIPMGLGLLIRPIIRDLPRESLANTLTRTRDGLRAPAAAGKLKAKGVT